VAVTPPDDRAVSPVISTILMVAVVVILAAVISTFVLGLGEKVEDPGPNVGQSSGDLEANAAGNDNGIVRLRHVAGDVIEVADMEVAVDASSACDKRGRLVALSLDETSGIQDGNVEGDDIFDQRPMSFHPLDDHGALEQSEFSAGERLQFRIPNNKCALSVGDEVTVRVVHVPTNSIVIEEELTATTDSDE
jgi:flagellin-like protein